MINQSTEINIALAADKNYLEPLETLIKLVCCWHKNVSFYLIQSGDINNAWIKKINNELIKFNSHLKNLIISDVNFNLHNYVLSRKSPLTTASFYRYFIPDLIDVDRVLYLDSDIVVNGSLLPLFEIDMMSFPIYASCDYSITWNTRMHCYQNFLSVKFIPFIRAEKILVHI